MTNQLIYLAYSQNQAAVLSEREEMRAAALAERAALEEARGQRVREREAFLAEVAAERRRLAEENAAAVGFALSRL